MVYVAFCDEYLLELPAGHRFPMEKYELIPRQLLYEQSYQQENFFCPAPMDPSVIAAVHDADYIRRFSQGSLSRKEQRRIGFPWSPELVKREQLIAFGTLQSALKALDNGIGFNVAGGTHHAFADHGEGFCIYNDIAVAAQYLLEHKYALRILIVDLDVHQGNGTAAIFANNPAVFTFSMHGERNYPLHKQISDLDIPLDDGTTDREYLATLEYHLPRILERFKPDFVFYQSGVDALNEDKLGKLSMTVQGLKERDAFVLRASYKHGLPLAASMGGGYAKRLRDIVEAHCNTFRLAADIFD